MLLSKKFHPFFVVYASVSDHCCFEASVMKSGSSDPVAECFDSENACMLAVLCNDNENLDPAQDARYCVFTRYVKEMMPSLFENLEEALAYKRSLEAETDGAVFGYDEYRLGRVYI